MKICSDQKAPLVLFLITQDWSLYTHRIELLRQTLKAGYKVAVMCHLGDHEAQLREEGCDIYPWKSISRGRLNPLYELASFVEVFRVYRRLRPNLIFQVSLKPVLYGTCAARLLRCHKIVNVIGGLGYLFMHNSRRILFLRKFVLKALKLLLKGKTTFLVLQNTDDLADLRGSVVPARTLLIPGSGVNMDAFQVGSRDHTPPRIIMVARLLKDKGILDYLEAAELLDKQGIAGDFFCAGSQDPSNPSCLSDEEKSCWESKKIVTFLGTQEDMPTLLKGMDIGVLPSYREGLPKALLECGAAGLPLVTTDVPGCREVVDPNITGFLVPPKDPKALANALAILIKDKPLRSRMGDESRKRIDRLFSQKIINETFLELFKKILS